MKEEKDGEKKGREAELSETGSTERCCLRYTGGMEKQRRYDGAIAKIHIDQHAYVRHQPSKVPTTVSSPTRSPVPSYPGCHVPAKLRRVIPLHHPGFCGRPDNNSFDTKMRLVNEVRLASATMTSGA